MIEIKPIGIIHSPHAEKEETPIQGAFRPEGVGWIEVFPEYEEGLKDIEGFSHIILLYVFDRVGPIQLVRPTFLDDIPHGIFASRHPGRPNSIGLTIVRLLGAKNRSCM
jgi:tRNA (adenine37-N6)-methyltransferase